MNQEKTVQQTFWPLNGVIVGVNGGMVNFSIIPMITELIPRWTSQLGSFDNNLLIRILF